MAGVQVVTYIRYTNLTREHARDFSPGDAPSHLVQPIKSLISDSLVEDAPIEIPGSGYSLSIKVSGKCLAASLWQGSKQAARIAVALRKTCGAALWRDLGRDDKQPSAPWLAVQESSDEGNVTALIAMSLAAAWYDIKVQGVALPWLFGTHPLGALASFGLLRILSKQIDDVRLKFELSDDWTAVYLSNRLTSSKDIVDYCVDWMKRREVDELTWSEDIRCPTEEFHRQQQIAAYVDASGDHEAFLAAFAVPGVEDEVKGLIKPTPMYMVSGQQNFFAGLLDIYHAVKKNPEDLFREAIVGPWSYKTTLHSMGWDPTQERLHALRHKAPSSEKPRCVAGAMWLAYEALPLLPCFSKNDHVTASGFLDIDGRTYFVWPLPATPVSYEQLKTLIQTRDHSDYNESLGAEYFCSERQVFGQGYATFRPASPWWHGKKLKGGGL